MIDTFIGLRPFYTQKDLNEAVENNKLFFFDVGYFCGFSVEHDGYSKYYETMDEALDDAYSFAKKYMKEMLAADRHIHFRAVKEVIPGTEGLGNGYMLGYLAFGKEDKIIISLDNRLDFCLDDFINEHDDVVLFEKIENVNTKVIRR